MPRGNNLVVHNFLLDPSKPPAVHYGAVSGLAAAGGPEAVRVLVLPNLKSFDAAILQPLRDKAAGADFETLVGVIVKAVRGLSDDAAAAAATMNGTNGATADVEAHQLAEFLGGIIGERVARLGDHSLNRAILDARSIE